MRIAVIGSGIAGLAAAWLLSRRGAVVLYEAEPRLGGHANTVDVPLAGSTISVDTGFLVYNEVNYPNLVRLFDHLGVETAPSDMSFAVSLDGGAFEYAGSPGGMVGQKSNLLRPAFWSMAADIARFYRTAPAALDAPADLTVGAWLARNGYGRAFAERHLLPMAAAIWSAPAAEIMRFPVAAFVRFFVNHGLLRFAGRPRWRTVAGGSRRYVERLAAEIRGDVRLATPVASVRRTPTAVIVRDAHGHEDRFDRVVLACHADQALRLLGPGAHDDERAVLAALRYQPNRAVLHTDPSLMPRRRRLWSSWNHVAPAGADPESPIAVTYWLNRLQPLATGTDLFLSMNPAAEPRPESVIAEPAYAHPLFDGPALAAQARLPAIQGRDRVWLCGAYAGWGFHEDGLKAGLAVAEALGALPPWAARSEPAATPMPDAAD